MEVKNILDAAELSMAAYADFAFGEINGNELLLQAKGMSESQAERFLDNYKVAIPTYNNPTNSFSATVFENQIDGSLTLAIRGSGVEDWISTNPDIAFRGAGYRQIVELFNWWSRVTTPTGVYARQFTITDPIEGAAPQLFESFRFGTGEFSGQTDSRLLVTGHSLGGHLAMAFGSLFPGDTEEVIVFDAPGFTDIDNLNGNFFRALGASGIPSDNWWTTNVIGRTNSLSTEDWSIIAGLHSQPGEKVNIEIEKQWQSDEPDPDRLSYDHSIKILVDSANVFVLLAQLDSVLDENTYKTLFESSSNSQYKTLEQIVDLVSELVRLDRPKLPTGNSEREALYRAIYEIQDNAAFKLLSEENFSIDTDLRGEEARNDFGVFLSTVFLSPLVFHANDVEAQNTLKAVHSELASLWARDLQLEDGNRVYTDQYLEDRSLMRSTLLESALLDEKHGRLSQKIKFIDNDSNAIDSITFDGDANGYFYPEQNTESEFDPERARYVFGSENNENSSQIISSDNNDHLYGMAGNDTIDGGEGSDHIEGGLGNDVLKGDEGLDSLNGGAGTDRFKWYSGDGDDVIVDYDDGGDRIIVNDIDLSTLTFKRRSVDSPFYVSDSYPEITLHFDGILTINVGSGEDAGSISISQYAPTVGKDYGITLVDHIEDWSHPTSVTVVKLGVNQYPAANETEVSAYWRQHLYQRGLDWSSLSITFDGTVVPGFTGDSAYGILNGTFEGGPLNDVLLGNAYGNALYGLAGDDFIDGRQEDDYLLGFAGSDVIFGGEGSDVIYGSTEEALLKNYHNGDHQDLFYLTYVMDEPGDTNTITGNSGQDYLTGGEYTDYIDGGEGRDWLFGGTGEDYLSGGIDTDIIYGDSQLHFYWYEDENRRIWEDRHLYFANGADNVGLYDDVINGGNGDDVVFGELGNDTMLGGTGSDVLVGDRENYVNYFSSPYPGCADTPIALNVSLHGDDQLFGGAGMDVLRGLGGSDLLVGGSENDFLIGGAGNDIYVFRAGDGRDLIQDDQGLHTLVFNGLNKNRLRIEFHDSHVFVGRGVGLGEEAGEGFYLSHNQWQSTNLALATSDGKIERTNLEAVYFDRDGFAVFTLQASNTLTEAERNALFTVDTSNPQQPKLVVKAGVEQARLEGYTEGGAGQLRITKGTSEYIVGISSVYMRSARSFIQMPAELSLTVSGGIHGSSADDSILGSDGADKIWGYDGDDVLDGRSGNDTIIGGNGRDAMHGGEGDDVLDGTTDNGNGDFFSGGTGNDTLKGGSGLDRYAFASGDGKDRLSDSHGPHYLQFATGVDRRALVLYYTEATDSKIRLEYGPGDAITTEGDVSVTDIAGVEVDGVNIPLIQRSDLADGIFYDTWMDDVFEPGNGNDVIHLRGQGTDVYRFHKGDGQDVLKVGEDLGGKSLKGEIRFAADVDLNTLSFQFANGDAIVGYGLGDRIMLDTSTVTSPQDSTFVRFKLVSEANPDWIPVLRVVESGTNFYGSYGTDHIIGSHSADAILPGYGDDIVEAGNGDDIVVLNDLYQPNSYGSIGHKKISGQRGNDTIIAPLHQGLTFEYDAGDGHDTIQFDWSYGLIKPYNFTMNRQASTAAFHPNGLDTLTFGTGISLGDLRFVRTGIDLKISLKDGTGSVMLKEFFHAWDVPRSPETASALYAMMDSAKHVNVETLLYPTVLAAMPTTPISTLRFADNTVFDMKSGLSAVLEVSNGTVTGTDTDDFLHGTEANDVIYAYGGNDYIEDLAGTNAIDAGTGNDRIKVGSGNIITAGSGNDIITLDGNNILHAGDGDDDIFATGNNVIKGGLGTDRIWLNEGNSVVVFGPGDGKDFVSFIVGPGAGTTTLSFDVGITPADIKVNRYRQDDIEFLQIYLPATGDSILPQAMLASEDGTSSTPHPRATFAKVRFANGTVITGDELFAMARFPPTRIDGTNANDWLIGTAGDEIFFGGRGDDVMQGEAGDDYFAITGHDQGVDQIVGGTGSDAIVGSPGADTITLSTMLSIASIEVIDGGGGVNVLAGTSAANTFYFANTLLLNISGIEGRDGDDWIWGSQRDDVIVGGRGNDVLAGEGGNDTFIVAGSDQGTDRIIGGIGHDVVRGGAGDDIFSFPELLAAAGLEVIDGGTGRNSIAGTASDNSLNFSGIQLLSIAHIDGKAGNDDITGSQGSDWLNGDAGSDTLNGGAGNDVFFGGTGEDILVGEAGDDIYMFALGDGRDQINNNDSLPTALDRLWLTNVDYDDVWLSRLGDSLIIDVVGATDQVRINHWYTGTEDQLDVIYARNKALMRNQVDQLVTAMAAFDVPTGVGAVIPQATRLELESTLTAVWKAA